MEIRRIRHFLGLRQSDVAAAVGITVSRLSQAENGRIRLNSTEKLALDEFYKARLRILAEAGREFRDGE
jgi:transcriptional regulator with XRE-family HTH domain